MKSLNRTLSLVLVLCMVFGLFGVAGAAFTDTATVQYTEAVGVMSGIGAINGYTDGSFKPAGTITREEAAKMVAYAVLGPTTAAKLSVTATGFKDVAATRWSAPFIGYCVSQGIINGMGDGTFAPTANVTGYQLAKMMLCAAGYGKASEFTGASWELNVAVAANKYKVFSGAKTADYSKAATREEAALYVFNAITKTPTATYSKLSESYTAVENKAVSELLDDNCYQIAESVYTTLVKETAYTDGRTGYYWKLGSTYISDFVGSDSVLATSTDGTSLTALTTPTSAKYIKFQGDTSVTYYINDYKYDVIDADTTADAAYAAGTLVLVGSLANGGDLWKVGTTALAKNDVIGAGAPANATKIATLPGVDSKVGVIVKFTDTDDNGKYNSVSFIAKAVMQLSANASTTTVGSVTTVVIPGVTNGINSKLISYPEGLVKGDVVLYYTSGDGTLYVEKAKVFAGTMTGYTDGATKDTIIVDGKTYVLSDLLLGGVAALNGNVGTLSAACAGRAATAFYLDNGGNVCHYYVTSATVAADKVVFVKAADATPALGTITAKASVVMADGTSKIITVKKVAKAGAVPVAVTAAGTAANIATSGLLAENTFYTYTTNDDGSYNLTAVEAYAAGRHFTVVDPAANACVAYNTVTGFVQNDTYATITKGQANFLTTYKADADPKWVADASLNYLANSATIFVIYDAGTSTYKTYTGIANVPSVTVFAHNATINVMMNSAGTYASLVVVSAGLATAASDSSDYAFVYGGATYHYDAVNPYYTFKAIINGTDGELKAAADTAFAAGKAYRIASYTNGVVATAYEVGANGGLLNAVYAAQTKLTVADGTLAIYNGATLTNSYVLNSAVKCFVFNTTYGTITAVDATALPTTYTAGTYTVQTVQTAANNTAIAYVFVTVS